MPWCVGSCPPPSYMPPTLTLNTCSYIHYKDYIPTSYGGFGMFGGLGGVDAVIVGKKVRVLPPFRRCDIDSYGSSPPAMWPLCCPPSLPPPTHTCRFT